MKYIFLLLLISLWPNFSHLSAQTTYSKEVEEQIKQVENNLAGRVKINDKGYNITERMAFFKVKGLSIAVVHNYKVVWAKGYGWADEKKKRVVTTETLFEPGSISKSLNAIGVLKLVQDKKLDLNVDINTYLKSWKFPYDSLSKNKKITLAHLLSHSAGLSVTGFPGYDRKAKLPTIPQILDGKAPANTPAVRSEFEPGLKYKYSGGGTTISRLIITDVTRQPYDKFMYDNILKPMGMANSFFSQPPPSDKLKLLATAYYSDGSEVKNKFHVYPEQGPDGLWTTPTDLCNYIVETQLAYEGRSSKVLTPEMTQLRLTPYIDESVALGVFIQERGKAKYFSHGARNEGFSGQYYGSLEGGNGVAIFLNTDNSSIIDEVVNSVATVYKWKDFYDPTVRNEITVPDSVLDKYIGVYRVEDKFATIFKEQDGYYYRADDINSKMHFTSPGEFFNQEFLTEKVFAFDTSGNVSGFLRKAYGKEYPFSTKITSPDTLHLQSYEFGNIAWQFFENKKYKEAVAYCKRGLQLYPGDFGLLSKMAHAYLYDNEYDKAVAIYKTEFKELIQPYSSWEETMQQVLIYFKDNGYDVKIFDRVFADLKIKKPKGY
ncbi:MAG: beta-lactamase [Bacteroidetes bacterium]|jgi:CubicO group peptidase (beta-lactamase class C family)|nr:beta-lactamase [Bacteroidota bacterium]